MTRNSVTDDQYGQLWRKLEEVARRVREGTIGFARTMAALQGVLEGSVVLFKCDMTKSGWTSLEDVPFDGRSFTPDIVEFLKPGESDVSGDVMRSRAKELNANLGQRHAEYLLEYQELIPKEYRQYYLAFPGTLWRDSDGYQRVSGLRWSRGGDRWYLYFNWLVFDWDSRDRLVSARK